MRRDQHLAAARGRLDAARCCVDVSGYITPAAWVHLLVMQAHMAAADRVIDETLHDAARNVLAMR